MWPTPPCGNFRPGDTFLIWPFVRCGNGAALEAISSPECGRTRQRFHATGLQARVRDDRPEVLEFISRRGSHESHRMGAYRLDFDRRDVPELQDAFARLRERRIEVTTLAAVRQRHPHYLEEFFELYSATRKDWQDSDPDPTDAPVRFDRLKRWWDGAQLPEGFVVAKQAQRYIAFTGFFGCPSSLQAHRDRHPAQSRIDRRCAAAGLSGADHLHSQSSNAKVPGNARGRTNLERKYG